VIAIPHLLSILATLKWNGEVTGLNELQAQYEQQYGPGNYVPNVFVQYWSMRVMAYLATGVVLLSLWGAWLLWRRRLEHAKWFLRVAVWAVFAPFLMNTAGWMLTENGRQPWIVQGLMKTVDGISPSVSETEIWISLTVFALLYLALGVVEVVLMLRYARRGLPIEDKPRETVPALTY
jgi:cytochrome bd ubiquinol oxidase subunit I